METIVNYLDIPEDERFHVIEQLLHIGFCPACGKEKTIAREMAKSQRNKLPQYLFVFREERLIGYSFLIGEKEHLSRAFPWWAVDNSDELPLEAAVRLLNESIALSSKCGCFLLADRLKLQLETQKKGIARRPEGSCR